MNDDSEDCEIIDVLASDFLARYRDGERPTVGEYVRRHPEYGESIRRVFPLVASIEKIKIDEQVASDGSATLAGRELKQLGDFRIVREIGRGGMGIVFEAHQESLDRVVAIKVLPKQSLLDDEALERFRTEATTAAAMHHANIVPIYGTGESEGSHYLVMQLVDGESLDTIISSDNELECQEVARIGMQIADAIAYSHAVGVLHRDIKPANILIEDGGAAQVTDFGLAKQVGDDLTKSRTVSGSLRYMAPERFAGTSDERGDIYGIGLTLYELLARRPAFEERDAEHLMDSIRNPRLDPIRKVRPEVPADLSIIISKAIHFDPKLRYQSAGDLRDDLERFLAGEPIHARRVSARRRLVLWSRRNPKIALAVGVASFALLAATIVSTVAYAMTSAANQRSADALKAAEQTVDLALNSLDGVVDVVSQTRSSPNLAVSDSFDVDGALPNVDLEPSLASANILARLQPIYERLSQQSPTRPDILLQMVDASVQLARIQSSLGQNADSMKTLQSSIELLLERGQVAFVRPDDLNLRLARLNNELGTLYGIDYRRDESTQCFESAIEAATLIDGSNDAGKIELARAYLNAGNQPRHLRRIESLTKQQRSDDLAQLNQAIQILQQLSDSDQATPSTNILQSRSLMARSRLINAPRVRRVDFQEATAILRRQLEKTPEDINVRYELVETLADVSVRGPHLAIRLADVSARLREALNEIVTLRGSSPDNTLFLASEVHLRHKLAAAARSQSRFDEADGLLSEAIRLQTLLIQTWPNNVRHRCWRAMLHRSQAAMYRERGDAKAAQRAIANANADLDAVDPGSVDHPLVNRTRNALSDF